MVRYSSRMQCAFAVLDLTPSLPLSSDQNIEETAVAAYWVTDGIDRCRVGFLPRHCVRQATTFDGYLVQVVALLANSDSPSQRRFSRHNRGACYATIIDTKVTQFLPILARGLPLKTIIGCRSSPDAVAITDTVTSNVDDDVVRPFTVRSSDILSVFPLDMSKNMGV